MPPLKALPTVTAAATQEEGRLSFKMYYQRGSWYLFGKQRASYFTLGTSLPLVSNPEAAAFYRGNNYFILRITQWKLLLYLCTCILIEIAYVSSQEVTEMDQLGKSNPGPQCFLAPESTGRKRKAWPFFLGPQNVITGACIQ